MTRIWTLSVQCTRWLTNTILLKADQFFFEHIHDPSDSSSAPFKGLPVNQRPSIAQFQKETALVRTTAEMRRYIHNIVTFLRLHRAAVGTSISALSSRQLTLLARFVNWFLVPCLFLFDRRAGER